MSKINKKSVLIITILITLGVTARLLVHLPNFTPIAAIAWFSAFYFPKRWAYAAVVITMLLSDLAIGFYTGGVLLAVYGSFLLMAYLGHSLKNNLSALKIIFTSLIGATVFYLTTNAAVWLFTPLYQKNISGLFQSLLMGLPFYRNALLGDLIYMGVLFGAYALVKQYAASKKRVARAR